MGKNIVLCSDGTGNKGGYTPDSNVYKIYKTIDIHNKGKQQITFYDNGIGTETNKYVRAATGALGIGFKKNVCDLYTFLARNYEKGDDVYFFGFSRGASTVRACVGFIAACGLVDGKNMKEDELKDSVKKAIKAYTKHKKPHSLAEQCKKNNSYGVIPIKFIGVWDTVSSLGFPRNWYKASIGLLALNAIFKALDNISEYILPHHFYNYKLTDNIKYACQALAIDDARTSFWPEVWNEKNRTMENVEQVWFAGMHSNVGGGYHRAGMANVALAWVMQRAINNGLVFKANSFENARADANPHGRIYDSRDGFAIYYRYHPREIEKLCKKKLNGNRIKIQESVIERMKHKTANYAPGNLPMYFDVVGDDGIVKGTTSYDQEAEKTLIPIRRRIRIWTRCRKWLYGMFLESTIAVAVFALYYKDVKPSWVKPIECLCPDLPSKKDNGIMGCILDKLDSVIPNFLNGAIEMTVIKHPVYFIGALCVFIGYWIFRYYCKRRSGSASRELHEIILKSIRSK